MLAAATRSAAMHEIEAGTSNVSVTADDVLDIFPPEIKMSNTNGAALTGAVLFFAHSALFAALIEFKNPRRVLTFLEDETQFLARTSDSHIKKSPGFTQRFMTLIVSPVRNVGAVDTEQDNGVEFPALCAMEGAQS